MALPSSLRALLLVWGVISVTNMVLFSVSSRRHGLSTPEGGSSTRRHSLHPRQSQWTVGQAVQTVSGVVTGHGASNLSDVSEYLGIPYAQPPVGNLRFQPPAAYNAAQALVNASTFGPSCFASVATASVNAEDYANVTITPTAGELFTVMYEATSNQSEDCLTLNIWTKPQDGDEKKAVLVWIHGGGYTSGGSAIPWYNGQFLAGEQDLVVVTINYRLSIFGFPGSPATRTNLGLLDQRHAVEWVRDNIAGFGGDPERIILVGQSAGGGSVDHYSYAWTSDPIVKGFIPMSGTATAFGLPFNATAYDNWFNTTAACGCGGAEADPATVHACMLSMPASDIVSNITRNTVTDAASGLPYSPTVDEELVFSSYADRKPIAAPVLVGNTDFETGLFRLLAPTLPATLWPLMNDIAFDCPAALRAAVSVQHGNPTWRYRWFGDFPNLVLSTVPYSGSWHASDLPLLFNNTPTNVLPDTPAEGAIGAYLRGAYAAFAKDPVNGLLTYGWPQYSTNDSTLIRLAYNNQTGPNVAIGSMYDDACSGIPIVESPNSNLTKAENGGAGTRIDGRANMAALVAFAATALLLCRGG